MTLLSVRAATEMKPKFLNKLCAHPAALASGLGALFADALIIRLLSQDVSLEPVLSTWVIVLPLLTALVAVSSLGCMLGLLLFWPLLCVGCSRYNGAPLAAGDHVMVLSGPQAGKLAIVRDLLISQGGWKLAHVDLGDEGTTKRGDIF
jgi:hypothetical protein